MLGAALVATVVGMHAQVAAAGKPVPAEAELAVPVLRAYVNVVQVPVLVLTEQRLRAAPLDARQFRMRIDGGPEFLPRRVRQEGADPIRLVVLVDAGPRTLETLARLGEALDGLAHVSLRAQDRVSAAVLRGCRVMQTSDVGGSGEEVRALAQAVQRELQATDAPRGDGCGEEARQRDALRQSMGRFGDSRSRRVLLLLTDGEDALSPGSVLALRDVADLAAVTVFALREQSAEAAQKDLYVLKQDAFAYLSASGERHRDPLVDLTERSGGMTLETRGHPLEESLERVLRLVRERYIVEFVRPSTLGAGKHSLEVEVRAKHLYVRSAGVGVPLPDPAVEADPNRVPSDRTVEPPVGTRRILPHGGFR